MCGCGRRNARLRRRCDSAFDRACGADARLAPRGRPRPRSSAAEPDGPTTKEDSHEHAHALPGDCRHRASRRLIRASAGREPARDLYRTETLLPARRRPSRLTPRSHRLPACFAAPGTSAPRAPTRATHSGLHMLHFDFECLQGIGLTPELAGRARDGAAGAETPLRLERVVSVHRETVQLHDGRAEHPARPSPAPRPLAARRGHLARRRRLGARGRRRRTATAGSTRACRRARTSCAATATAVAMPSSATSTGR